MWPSHPKMTRCKCASYWWTEDLWQAVLLQMGVPFPDQLSMDPSYLIPGEKWLKCLVKILRVRNVNM